MQLPDHLLRTYRRYKESERHLLDWILAAALTTCANSEVNQKPAKLKGRARTEARREAAFKNANDRSRQSAKALPASINLFDIIPPIRSIADNPAITSIPPDIVSTFKTILELRQRCAAWFRSNTTQLDSITVEANKKHLYPIQLLQQALRLLATKIIPEIPVSLHSSPKTHKGNDPPCHNIFTLLDLEETVDESDESSTTGQSMGPDPQVQPNTNNKDRIQDEFNLAMYCLHTDLEELEDCLILKLARYAIDQKNADTLPFLINTAIDQALHMQVNIDRLVDDPYTARDKFDEFNHEKNHDDKNKEQCPTSSLRRLQGQVGMEMSLHSATKTFFAQFAKDNGGRTWHGGRIPFPSQEEDMHYLSATDAEKWWIEAHFLQTC